MRCAGLVDLQVNGFAGVDFNAGPELTAAEMDTALAAMRATGVRVCLPTVITATPAELASRLAALDAAISASRLGPAMCPGYHLEGPFLNPADGYAGCHPATAMTVPDAGLVARLEEGLARPILMATLAPELPGAEAAIRTLGASGKLVAVGHSDADPAALAMAAASGAAMVTHLGNGLPQVLPKFGNVLMAGLAEDGLAASVIADGIHVPPFALKVMLRAKQQSRCLLVTDATAAAAAPAGRYRFAGMEIERAEDGSVRVPGARSFAGSSLCLDQAVRNVVAWGLASTEEALGMASAQPLALLRPALVAHGLRVDLGEIEWLDQPHRALGEG